MTRYVFTYAEVYNKDRLQMTNLLPLTMRWEYTDSVFFWQCLHGRYDVDAPLVMKWFWISNATTVVSYELLQTYNVRYITYCSSIIPNSKYLI